MKLWCLVIILLIDPKAWQPLRLLAVKALKLWSAILLNIGIKDEPPKRNRLTFYIYTYLSHFVVPVCEELKKMAMCMSPAE